MATYDPSQTGNYYILGDSHAEMVQLIETDRIFNKSMGGLLAEQSDQSLSHLHRILDVACGPGGWLFELARAYPHLDLNGIDISEGMIAYAQAQARASGLDNLYFQVASAINPFPFPDDSFDLVNARQIEGVIPTASWPAVLKEMVRVARPGGIIRVTGNEWGVSNSEAFERLQRLDIRAWEKAGLSHSADERNCGICMRLGRYLCDAGCVNVQERPSMMDISAGSEFHQAGYEMCKVGCDLIEPFFVGMGVMTREELARLRDQISLEMLDESFRGIIYTLTAWGQKP
jgi:SAM-dependent methyltransferase